MAEYAFRKIDIDALDEEVLLHSDLYDPDPRGPDAVNAEAKQKAGEARGLVSKSAACPSRLLSIAFIGRKAFDHQLIVL